MERRCSLIWRACRRGEEWRASERIDHKLPLTPRAMTVPRMHGYRSPPLVTNPRSHATYMIWPPSPQTRNFAFLERLAEAVLLRVRVGVAVRLRLRVRVRVTLATA